MLVSNESEWHAPCIMWRCKEGTACLRSMSVDQVQETSNTLGIWHDLKVSSEPWLHYVSSSVLVIKSTQITTGVVWFLTFHVTLFDRHYSLNNLHIGEEIWKALLGKKTGSPLLSILSHHYPHHHLLYMNMYSIYNTLSITKQIVQSWAIAVHSMISRSSISS